MPYVKIETNVEMRNDKEFCLKASKLVSSLTGKPENYVMINFKENEVMSFAGNVDPCVFVEFKSIGLREDDMCDFSRVLTDFLEAELRIPGQRIYINFVPVPSSNWGYNGDTF